MKGQYRFLFSVALAFFVTQIAASIVAPLLVDLAADFDTSVAVTGQLASATFAAWAVSVIVVGPLSDSLGRRPVALAGLSLLSIGVLASAFAPNIGTLMVLRVITGLGGGAIPPNSMAAVADSVAPAHRARAVGGIMAFAMLSAVIGLPFVAVIAGWGTWRLPFLVSGSLLVACTLLNWFWFPKSEAAGTQSFSFLSRYRTLLALPIFRATLAVNLAQRLAFFALFSYLAAYLIDVYDMNVGAVAGPLVIVGLGTPIGTYIGGQVANRRDRMLLIGAFASVGGVAALLFFSIELQLWAAVALAMGSTTMLSVGWPVVITLATEVSGQSRATGIGLLGVTNQGGGFGGAAFGGVLLASTGFPGIGYLCLGAAAFSAVVIGLFLRRPVSQV